MVPVLLFVGLGQQPRLVPLIPVAYVGAPRGVGHAQAAERRAQLGAWLVAAGLGALGLVAVGLGALGLVA
eukprot:8165116-Pyramimonas_sp.AAC.1